MNQQDKDRLRKLAEVMPCEHMDDWDAQFAGPAILSLLAENEELARKAARYDWLRYGDNDAKVLKRYISEPDETDDPTMYLPRETHLDDAIDAAMQPKGE